MHIPGNCHYPKHGLGWVGGKKEVWGRGAGARHCATLNVLLKVLPTSHFHQESGHSEPEGQVLDDMSYRNYFLFLLPRGSCSQWIIGCTCTFTRNSFHAETVYKVLMKAFFHKPFFLSEKCLPLNMPSQLHCVFVKDVNAYEFLVFYYQTFLFVDLYSVSVLVSDLQRPYDVNI